jgi:hypothetical protein
MSKRVKKKQKINIKKIFIWGSICVALLLALWMIFGVPALNKWLDEQDKQRFLTQKQNVEEISSKLQVAIPEIEWKVESTCRRAHLTFGDGEASCYVEVVGIKNVNDSPEVTNTFIKFDDVLSSSQNLDKVKDGTLNPPNFVSEFSEGYIGGEYKDNITSMGCGPFKGLEKEGSNMQMKLYLLCDDDARDTWFPRSDK